MRITSITSVIVFLLSVSLSLASLNDGLVGHWNFDEGSGQTLTDSVNGHNGTIYGATWTTGINGSALQFDGSNDYAQIANNSDFDFSAGFSLCAWIKPTYNSSIGRIIYRYDFTSRDAYFLSQHYSYYYLNVGVDDVGPNVKSDVHSVAGQWAFLVGVRENNGDMKIYVNGILQNSFGNCSGVIDQSGDLFFGCDLIGDYHFSGVMDDIRIYNRSLTANEVSQLAVPEPGTLSCLILGIFFLKKRKI
jgi:hypothetical protein